MLQFLDKICKFAPKFTVTQRGHFSAPYFAFGRKLSDKKKISRQFSGSPKFKGPFPATMPLTLAPATFLLVSYCFVAHSVDFRVIFSV